MTFINVAPGVYYEAATICSAAAVAFFDVVTEQFGDLALETAEMAGSIGDGKVWAESYDQQTTDTYLLFKSLIGAIDNYSDILVEAGYNYAVADHDGSGPVPGRPATPQPALLECPAAPASAGGSGKGLVDDGLDLATQIGVPIPDGDADKLAKAAGCWNTLATGQATANLPAELERAGVLFQEVTAPDVSFIDEDLRELKAAAEDLLTTFADLATACRDQEAAHRKLRADLATILEEFAVDIGTEVMVTLALSIGASVVSFGMGSAAVAAIRAGKFATKVKHYVDRLRKVMDIVKLKTAVTVQKSTASSRNNLQRIIDLTKKHGDEAKKTKMTPEQIRARVQDIGDEVKSRSKDSEPRNPEFLAQRLSELNLSHDEALEATIQATEIAFGSNSGTANAVGGGTALVPRSVHHGLVMIVKPDGSVVAARGDVTELIEY
ncbi:hypothetical protein [Nocardia jinanensis]|uniref:Uncharacterized protein n=1 Tax=Nocardia jinanensis TaxID=382504 RepID=A0A917RW05_9NOCA|nr:hypothetical protein [Nocardia jinanensis]GGL40947.1 hypothetical protein GCM10011588_64680 [Nocardia jinanensis]